MTPIKVGRVGRTRTVIERVTPEIDGGSFPIKRTVGEEVIVEADIFADGHDQLQCLLLHQPAGTKSWIQVPMSPIGNDRWQGRFPVTIVGRHKYTLTAWVDPFLTWRQDLTRRQEPDDISTALQVGAELIGRAASSADSSYSKQLQDWVTKIRNATTPQMGQTIAQSEDLAVLMAENEKKLFITEYGRILEIVVDIERARFSTWYEIFPRSCLTGKATHGTFAQLSERLPYIDSMGFDVLYLPPIHPIGNTFRKGPNNKEIAEPGDPGSPWAIGSPEGGHHDIYSKLGSAKDFRRLVRKARELGIEIALDIAFQCSPDHPYVAQHPDWFRHRPDGSIQYAENPPKKYQDIYPLNFECEDWKGLWHELKSIIDHWIGEGVLIFRVDNPHTKPFPFWEWLISEVKTRHPEVIFLAEAFTRPKIMYRLAKLGFTQSYTYFTWRNTKQELTDYFTELSQHDSREYFRPNLWPNTPDILHEFLQHGGRSAFLLRIALAATLGASYGIYGPAYELMEHEARETGSEEYLNSEKYQLRDWNLEQTDSLRDHIALLNHIRRDNLALHSDWSLRFHTVDNSSMICYSKTASDNTLVMVANLDPHHVQDGWVEIPIGVLGVFNDLPYTVRDLLSGATFRWQGERNYVSLDPQNLPMHIFRFQLDT